MCSISILISFMWLCLLDVSQKFVDLCPVKGQLADKRNVEFQWVPNLRRKSVVKCVLIDFAIVKNACCLNGRYALHLFKKLGCPFCVEGNNTGNHHRFCFRHVREDFSLDIPKHTVHESFFRNHSYLQLL
nr:MAG TPA: hypothetical protein [Caudoviricetes sp.]